MENNLETLNDLLFETLIGVKDGKIKVDQANAVVNISNTLINTAKVQLQAMKMLGASDAPKILAIESSGEYKDRYQASVAYAISGGYKNIPEAITCEGKYEFNKGVDKFIKALKIEKQV